MSEELEKFFAKHQARKRTPPGKYAKKKKPNTEPDWTGTCDNCGASPIVPCTGMCGPCTFGEADTANGNW